MNEQEKYIALAIEQAKIAKQKGGLPFGAVVVYDGEVVGRGYDTSKITHDVTAHAEVNALRSACETLGTIDLSNCTIYCTNEPCNMCGCAIFQAEIKEIVIGLTRDDLPNLLRKRNIRLADLANDTSYTLDIKTGVLKDQILELFSDIRK